ncbi:ABC transporter substrate-binding protein [Bradyrhizobium sp. B124]|uniref:ABC transporter substrate-binding protein n=1 Tax=Bradyrhizobium sp. B124 TaxID=3140245 RepID=UPI00318429CF
MRRRELIFIFAGAAASSPFVARAQRPQQVRRIGVVMLYPENDPQGQLRATVFQRQLEKAGWTIGGNLQVSFRWGTGDAEWVRSATERALRDSPDVLLANGDAAMKAAQTSTQMIPVIFIGGGDPVGDGIVQSLAHPGGNVTGFTVMEPSLGAKLLGLLKQVAPQVARVAVLMNPDNATHKRILALLETAAPGFAVNVISASVREATAVEAAMSQWGQGADYGLIVPSDPTTNSQRKLFVELAARYRLPTIYALRAAVADGGLMSYGVDLIELFRQAAIYADRILKGEKPANLPVQLPTKFELVVNLKTAKGLGLDIPASLLATADEVIE